MRYLLIAAAGICVMLSAAGCGPDPRDQEYLRTMRPLVVQYAELANDFNNYLPGDFDKFSANIEALRKQAILVYPPSSKKLRQFNAEFIDLLNKARKAGFVFGTEFLDCEEQANGAKEYDRKVDLADKWRWDARESSQGFGEAHQKIKPYMQKTFEYPVSDIDLKPAITAFAKQMVQ